jgi:hypothetical protein
MFQRFQINLEYQSSILHTRYLHDCSDEKPSWTQRTHWVGHHSCNPSQRWRRVSQPARLCPAPLLMKQTDFEGLIDRLIGYTRVYFTNDSLSYQLSRCWPFSGLYTAVFPTRRFNCKFYCCWGLSNQAAAYSMCSNFSSLWSVTLPPDSQTHLFI